MAFYKDLTKVRLVAYLIAIILMARWAVRLFFTMQYDNGFVSQIIPDTIAIIVVGLLFLDIRIKSKDADAQ